MPRWTTAGHRANGPGPKSRSLEQIHPCDLSCVLFAASVHKLLLVDADAVCLTAELGLYAHQLNVDVMSLGLAEVQPPERPFATDQVVRLGLGSDR